ncbi:hypothetical protein [Rosistilla oblonga]|uniref:hypothetical protein n=1 Tax=Rosistilla oblonga TaxID=2527990 RepID=UPI00119DA3EE|nr:hypothetical protein [Rosistilla oblonga]
MIASENSPLASVSKAQAVVGVVPIGMIAATLPRQLTMQHECRWRHTILATKKDINLGFYLVQNDETAGWMGGYLVLNSSGRPLEFHCSLPLRPTRTQQILYGPSLGAYLVGDLIGKALLDRAKMKTQLVLADNVDALPLARRSGIPFACTEVSKRANIDDVIEVDGWQAIASPGQRDDVMEILQKLPATFDLNEPFDRIREAFSEARGTSRAAA